MEYDSASTKYAKARAFDNMVEGYTEHVVSKRAKLTVTTDKAAETVMFAGMRGKHTQKGDVTKLHTATGINKRKFATGKRKRQQIEAGEAGVTFSSLKKQSRRGIDEADLKLAFDFYLEKENSKIAQA